MQMTICLLYLLLWKYQFAFVTASFDTSFFLLEIHLYAGPQNKQMISHISYLKYSAIN